jgi:hypothetical protein
MIEEIIYTSAEKGLKAGSRGFCTVVSTAGMAINMAERLESMSGYRHAFPLQSPQAVLNPINHSHVTMRIGGKLVHVLSRIADAGQDYSGRTNKLAHHLAMDDVSRFVSGPARLMEQSGVLVTSWDGQVRTMAPRNIVGAPMPSSVTLSAWKRVTGDSGWAGWVAEQLSQDKAPVSVIFAAGTETLLLVREVLDLLPPSQRWGVTFSTYFTKLLAGTECQLRFVLDDTPEATALRNDARAKVVDLLRKNPPAIGGALVQQARTELIQLEPSAPSPKPVAKPQASSSKPAVRSAERTTERTTDEDSDTYRMSKPSLPGAVPSRPSLPPRLGDRVFDTPEAPSLRRFETSREKRNRTPLIIGAVAVLMLCLGVGVGALIFRSGKQNNNPTLVTSSNPQAAAPSPDSSEGSNPLAIEEKGRNDDEDLPATNNLGAESEKASQPAQIAVNASTEGGSAASGPVAPSNAPAPSSSPKEGPPEKSFKDPFAEAVKHNSIPSVLGGESQLFWVLPTVEDKGETRFPIVIGSASTSITFEAFESFLNHEQVKRAFQNPAFGFEELNDDGRRWRVSCKSDSSSTSSLLGEIYLDMSSFESEGFAWLSFQWTPNVNGDFAELFRWCPLILKIEDQPRVIVLRNAESFDGGTLREFYKDGFTSKEKSERFSYVPLHTFPVEFTASLHFPDAGIRTADFGLLSEDGGNRDYLPSICCGKSAVEVSLSDAEKSLSPVTTWRFAAEKLPTTGKSKESLPFRIMCECQIRAPQFMFLNPEGEKNRWRSKDFLFSESGLVAPTSQLGIQESRSSIDKLMSVFHGKRGVTVWWKDEAWRACDISSNLKKAASSWSDKADEWYKTVVDELNNVTQKRDSEKDETLKKGLEKHVSDLTDLQNRGKNAIDAVKDRLTTYPIDTAERDIKELQRISMSPTVIVTGVIPLLHKGLRAELPMFEIRFAPEVLQ